MTERACIAGYVSLGYCPYCDDWWAANSQLQEGPGHDRKVMLVCRSCHKVSKKIMCPPELVAKTAREHDETHRLKVEFDDKPPQLSPAPDGVFVQARVFIHARDLGKHFEGEKRNFVCKTADELHAALAELKKKHMIVRGT
jgi:hypothetical protein